MNERKGTLWASQSSILRRIASFNREAFCGGARPHYPLGAYGPVVSLWQG
jgi:hypothetical protein